MGHYEMWFRNFFSRTSRYVFAGYRRGSTENSDNNCISSNNTNNKNANNDYGDKTLYYGVSYGKKFRIISYIGLFFIFLLLLIGKYLQFTGPDVQQCRPVWMYPSYARIDGFDTRFTRLAHKYHLYLYREQGKDKEPLNGNEIQLDGIPVLFIPGNAGSFKQARSIASESANIYYDFKDTLENKMNTRNLDFFTADFNEDFTAFHGQTMLDQAEYLNDAISYILSLYEESSSYDIPLPESVIIVAHSMGGIVTRLMMTLENHIPGSINTILTLSSPHAVSPVTFDGDILKIYRKIDDYWVTQFYDKDSFFSRNVSLISITGGVSDDILPADYAFVADLIPPENGFTTFTTTIPNVWTPIDHLAIVWCKQLRHVLARLLLEIVDCNSHSKTKPLEERIEISKQYLLSGFENYARETRPLVNPESSYTIPDVTYKSGINIVEGNTHLNIDEKNYDTISEYTKVIIPSSSNLQDWTFNLLTSITTSHITFCIKAPTMDSQENIRCVSSDEDILTIPKSTIKNNSPADASWDEDDTPFKMLSISGNALEKYDFIIIQKPSKEEIANSNFLFFSLSNELRNEIRNTTPLDILLRDEKISLQSGSGITTKTWDFPNLWNSLISYQLIVFSKEKDNDDLFEPFLKQATFEPFETKWHVNIRKLEKLGITMHNVAPFIPIDETQTRMLSFTLTIPPETDIEMHLKINWGLTLKLLFIRYRLAIASFLATFTSFVLFYQFSYFKTSNKFISFQESISIIIQKFGYLILFGSIILSPIVNNKWVERALYLLDPVRLNDPFASEEFHIYNNYYYLGIRDFFSSFIGLLFTLMTMSVLFVFGKFFDILEYVIAKVTKHNLKRSKVNVHTVNERIFDKKRITGCIILATAVVFYIPYQLAFLLMVFVQSVTCIRAIIHYNKEGGNEHLFWKNVKNYNMSILLYTIIVAIIDSPIIIVFFHNVAIKWETTLNSHHNVLAILPFILFVIGNSKFRIPSYSRSIDWFILLGLITYIAYFSTIHGIRNLFWLHHITNILSGWLFYGCLNI